MNLHTFVDTDEWISATVQEITKDMVPNTTFSLALSGGRTPAPIYTILAQQKLPWEKAEIFQVDERFVLPGKAESNARLLRESFLHYREIPEEQIYFFDTSGKISWPESALQYDRLLQQKNVNFDVCILGIGPDGHTASLFPHEPAIHETDKLATTAETNQFAVWKRLTLTFPCILSSKKIIVLLKGIQKKETLHEFLHGEKNAADFPSKKLLEHNNMLLLYCENDA